MAAAVEMHDAILYQIHVTYLCPLTKITNETSSKVHGGFVFDAWSEVLRRRRRMFPQRMTAVNRGLLSTSHGVIVDLGRILEPPFNCPGPQSGLVIRVGGQDNLVSMWNYVIKCILSLSIVVVF